MVHHVCPACGGVSDAPKKCETTGCVMQGQDLKECRCEDDQHSEVHATQPAN